MPWGSCQQLLPHAQVIDIDGVNRTPKPLVAIVQSAALRQATGLLSDDAGGTPGVGGDGDGFVQLLNSTGFSRGWFDSGAATPLGGEASMASAVGESPCLCSAYGGAGLRLCCLRDPTLHRMLTTRFNLRSRRPQRHRRQGA
jgi:hypothetical protein